MSAPSDPVNETPRPKIGGRYKPPAANLTGRTGACDILGIDKRGLRRLEDKGVLKPAVVQPNGVRWFDVETVWRLAVERQKRGVKQRPRPRSRLPEGVQRVTGAETQRITEWFAAGLSHAEVVMRSGKTHETIRYLYAQYVTPSGVRVRMTAPTGAARPIDAPTYCPEDEGRSLTPRPGRTEQLPKPPSHVLPHRATTSPVRPAVASPAASAAPRRPLTKVPDAWFTAPLPPVADDETP